MLSRAVVLIVGVGLWVGCAQEPTGNLQAEKEKALEVDVKGASPQKADRWSSQDAPRLFSEDLVYALTELPLEGVAARTPWAGSYWPVYQDGINFKWEGPGSLSPAGKYGSSFGMDQLEDEFSRHHGIDYFTFLDECEADSECDDEVGEVCAKRNDAEIGRCIPTWWGICHAWAPASIMEPEPVQPVTINGVEFRVNDIKALISLMYNRSSSRFVSLRCNENDSLDEIEYDGYDRPTGDDLECKDTNPGTYHVILANYLGLKEESFVEDRTFDSEVWNQPLSAYRITEMNEVTSQEANVLVGMLPDGSGMKNLSYLDNLTQGTWKHHLISVKAGDLVSAKMTGSTGDADLYIRFGADQPTQHVFDCRSWEHGSNEACEMNAPEGTTQAFVSSFGYEGSSTVQVDIKIVTDPMAGVPEAYAFNSDATYLYSVKSEVDFISESPSSMDGNLSENIAWYTHTDHYEYILEVDAEGLVIGGEWLGLSKKNHPDFLWLPTGRNDQPIAGRMISYGAVKEMLELSISESLEDNEVQLDVIQETVAKNTWKHYGPFEAGEGSFVVKMSGTGDADLYVRKDAQPTSTAYLCRPYDQGSIELCELSGSGTYYVSTFGYQNASFELVIRYSEFVESPEPVIVEPDPEPVVEDATWPLVEEASIARHEWRHYGPYTLEEGTLSLSLTGSGDADLYVRSGAQPTASEYDCRPYVSGSNESCTIDGPGEIYVSVRGYTAAEYVLTMAFEELVPVEPVEVIEDDIVSLTLENTVAKGSWVHYGPYEVSGGDFAVVMTGSGDADLYVRRDAQPTATDYHCRPYRADSDEDCTLPGPGTFYVAVYGYTDAQVELVIEFSGEEALETPAEPEPEAAAIEHLNLEGSVAQGEMKIFTLTVPAHHGIHVATTAPEDIDLYLKVGVAPTTSDYDHRAYTYSGNESLDFSSPTEVTLHIGVHGYKASDFTLQTSDN